MSLDTPSQSRRSIPVRGLLAESSSSHVFDEVDGTPPVRSLPSVDIHTSPIAVQDYPTVTSHAPSHTSIPASLPEETNQDRAEAGFFLRHFAEGAGQWMDIITGQSSYFSQYVVQLASQSPLVRYSACSLAAKQLGQMKDYTQMTDKTHWSSIVASALLKPGLDFLWYGAKYYEKAILLLARQISDHPSSTAHLSPREIYQSTSSDHLRLDDHESTSTTFPILSACMLCAYEDLSGTMPAWSGHLDGINKLLRPHIDLHVTPVTPDNLHRTPESLRGLETSFWYFALNDILNCCEFGNYLLLRCRPSKSNDRCR